MGVCFLSEDDGLAEYWWHFEKIADISVAELDRIWKRPKRRKGTSENSNH